MEGDSPDSRKRKESRPEAEQSTVGKRMEVQRTFHTHKRGKFSLLGRQ